MPTRKPRVWTTRRKFIGNALPLSIGLLAAAVVVVATLPKPGDAPSAGIRSTIAALAAFVVVSWISTNQLGLWRNTVMRRELSTLLQPPAGSIFVGFASPKFKSLLDPHEDLGFLILEPGAVRFLGERREARLDRSEVREIDYAPSTHTWLGLGRWVRVRGEVQGKPVALRFEPREASTLLGNLRRTKKIAAMLRQWKDGPEAPNPEPEPV